MFFVYVSGGNLIGSKIDVMRKDLPASSVMYVDAGNFELDPRLKSRPMLSEKWFLLVVGIPGEKMVQGLKGAVADVVFLCRNRREATVISDSLNSSSVTHVVVDVTDKDKERLVEIVMDGVSGIKSKDAKYLVGRCGGYLPRVIKVINTLSRVRKVYEGDGAFIKDLRKNIVAATEDFNLGSFLNVYRMMLGMYVSSKRRKDAYRLLSDFRYAYSFVFSSILEESEATVSLYRDISVGRLTSYNMADYAKERGYPLWRVKGALSMFSEVSYEVVYVLDLRLRSIKPSIFSIGNIVNLCDKAC